MKTNWILVLLLGTALSLAGCSKKEPVEPSGNETQNPTGMLDNMKEAAAGKMEEVTEAVKESLTMDIDVNKAVSDLKAEAAKMSLEDLQAVAMKYKTAIMENSVEIDKIKQKLEAIPAVEKLGTEFQELTAELKVLNDALKPLTDRFQIYLDAIQAKGGDISELTL